MKKPVHLAHCFVWMLLSANARAADDPHIRQVEQGLLPVAAIHPGVTTGIEDRMRAYGVPGLSIAVIDGGRIMWAKGYGVADTVSRRPVTPETLFQAASISKPVSALGALLLVQQGRIQLDASANHALRSWKIPDNAIARGDAVTVRMLLNHTDGLEHGTGVSLVSVPGKTFAYSAAGYEVLQQLVTDVSSLTFEQYMQSAVFAPLGMKNSTFEQPLPESLRSRAATGHYAGGERLPGNYRLGPKLAVAGLWTTPTDVARYIISVQRSYAGAKGEPLAPETTRQMLTPGMGSRGLGPVISGSGGSGRFGHDGFNEGFESSFAAYESRGQGAIVMTNSGFAFMLIKEVLSSVSRAYGWSDYGATTQQPPAATIEQQPVSAVSPSTLTAIVGHYALGDTRITLSRSHGRLLLGWPTNGVAEVFATPDGRLFCAPLIFSDVGSPWLKLVRDSKGRVTKVLAGDDGSIELARLN